MSLTAEPRRQPALTSLRELGKKLGQLTQGEIPYQAVVLAVLLVAGLVLRLGAVAYTTVDGPVRADAKDYLLYAYNTRYHGVYSSTDTISPGKAARPAADARRVPLYPLFMAPFLANPPINKNLTTITRAQALISTLCIFLVYLLARRILPLPLALGAAGLTAISPHLVNMNVYLLSETLLSCVLVLAIYLTVRTLQEGRVGALCLPGLVLGAAALTHPLVTYLVLPLAMFVAAAYPAATRWKAAGALLLGFALVYAPWIARNVHTLGTPDDNRLLIDTLHHGMYIDMMYQGDPATWRSPYRADPRSAEISRNLASVTAEIARNLREAPAEYLRWYLIGKPVTAWSWGIVVGQGDVFVYPTTSSPYWYRPHFQATHWFMRMLHGPLVLLMAAAAVLAWLPRNRTRLTAPEAVAARVVSILLLYHIAVMTVGFPLPRYAVPLRPFMYLMALLTVSILTRRLIDRRHAHAAP